MEERQLKDLIEKFLDERATPDEERTLMDWYFSADLSEIRVYLRDEDERESIRQRIRSNVMAHASQSKSSSADAAPTVHSMPLLRLLTNKWFRYAAAILVIAITSAIVASSNRKFNRSGTDLSRKDIPPVITPGGERATLTLADGSTITLDNAGNGALAQQGNAQVVKLTNGQIAYNLKGVPKGEVMMNTMVTPNGGQYQLILPDGTHVWLNAASSITYPTTFVETNRRVKVTGEAYFEVAKNKAKPFIVDVDGKSSIQVLGTSFNVNSYKNEGSIKTTLLAGSIKVIQRGQSAVLTPGQQATVAVSSDRQAGNGGRITVTSGADLDQTLAWKEGVFDFNGADLKAVMRQLERWYDISVQYKGPVSNEAFKGKMYRNVNLSDVLEMLKKMNVQMELDGRNLTVL